MADEPEDFSEIEAQLDGLSIPEQVARFENLVEEAKAKVFIAWLVAQRLGAAVDVDAGLLKEEEGERYANTVLEKIRDLKAMLVCLFGGQDDQKKLRQLHDIFYVSSKGADGGAPYTLEDDMWQLRRWQRHERPLESLAEYGIGPLWYWKAIEAYLAKHPDEPNGWRERMKGLESG